MSQNQLLTINEAMQKLFPEFESSNLNENLRLKEDLGIDSLRLVELLVAIEEDLNVMFDEADLDPGKIATVQDIIVLINKKRS